MITQTIVDINPNQTHALVESKKGKIYPVEIIHRMRNYPLEEGDKVQIRVRNGHWLLVGVVM